MYEIFIIIISEYKICLNGYDSNIIYVHITKVKSKLTKHKKKGN